MPPETATAISEPVVEAGMAVAVEIGRARPAIRGSGQGLVNALEWSTRGYALATVGRIRDRAFTGKSTPEPDETRDRFEQDLFDCGPYW